MSDNYKFKVSEKEIKELSEDQIFDFIYNGKFTGTELISLDGKSWEPVSNIKIFATAINAYKKTLLAKQNMDEKTAVTKTIATVVDTSFEENTEEEETEEDYLSVDPIDPYSEESRSIPSMLISPPKKKNNALRAFLFTLLMVIAVIFYLSYVGLEKTKEFYAGKFSNIDKYLFSLNDDLVSIELPIVDSDEYNLNKSNRLFKEATELMAKDTILAYREAEEKLQEAHVYNISNKSIISLLAYVYSKLYYVSKMDSDYLNTLNALVTRGSHGDMDLQTTTLAQVSYQNLIGNYTYAISIFKDAISLLKNVSLQPLFLISGVEAYLGEGNIKEATIILDKLIEAEEAYPRIYYLKGLTIEKEDEIKAIEYYQQAIQIEKNHIPSILKILKDKAKYTLDDFYSLAQKYKFMSLKEASEVLQMFADFAEKEKKSKDFIIQVYKHALTLYFNNPIAQDKLNALGVSFTNENKKQDLVVIKQKSNVSLFLMRGDELFSVQKYRDAALQYRMAASMDPTDSNVWYKLGEAYRNSYEYEKALGAFLEGLKQNKISVPILTKLSQVQIDLYDFNSAYKQLKKAELLDPENPDVLYTLGYLFEKQGNDNKAVNYYHKALSNDFSHFDSIVALAKKHYKFKSYDDSLLLFKRALSVKPDYFEAYIYIASIKAKTEPIDKVKRYIESIKKNLDSVPELDLAIAVAYMEKKNYDESERIMKNLRKKYKYSLIVIRYIAKLLLKQARITEYLSYLNLITILAPYDLKTRYNEAITYCNIKKVDICEKRLRDILQLTPYYPRVSFKLGQIYYVSNQYGDAEDALKTEIKYNPGIKQSYLLLGEIYLKTNRAELAVQLFRNMLAHNPNEPYGFLGLARACFYSGDFDCTKEFIGQAKAVNPDITEIYFIECELYYKLNLFSESRSACKTFLKRAPRHFGANRASEILLKVS